MEAPKGWSKQFFLKFSLDFDLKNPSFFLTVKTFKQSYEVKSNI